MRIVSHPEAEQELEAAALCYCLQREGRYPHPQCRDASSQAAFLLAASVRVFLFLAASLAKISGGGKVQRRSFGVVDKAVADIQTTNFNQLEVAYSIARDGGFRLPGNPISVVGLLTVSPTCDLWFKSQTGLPVASEPCGPAR